ncbi:hypothetical protein QBC40DRAFT_106149 [Triangularia verruculosa]|uniref:Uncharacterized protein n=1 Tax=Triangularia verruculosa TaxID=2587418 RepID=A0AAN6XB38_9PEZI|nr:hypothetical protein QBC40DRAFT_106149 [Triangularia verruculosa]
MRFLRFLPLLTITLTTARPTDSSEEPSLPLPKPNDLYNCPPTSRSTPLLSKGASPPPPAVLVKPWFNNGTTTTIPPLTRRDVARKGKVEDPYSFNHGPMGKVHPWKDGEGPWRWGRDGKRYSERGCGKTCRLKCHLNKVNMWYRLVMQPHVTLAVLLGKKYNMQRMKSDCGYVCGAFCEYAKDVTEEELAAHFGVKLSVQTREYYPDGSVDDYSPVSYNSFPPAKAGGKSVPPPQKVRFKDGKMLHD